MRSTNNKKEDLTELSQEEIETLLRKLNSYLSQNIGKNIHSHESLPETICAVKEPNERSILITFDYRKETKMSKNTESWIKQSSSARLKRTPLSKTPIHIAIDYPKPITFLSQETISIFANNLAKIDDSFLKTFEAASTTEQKALIERTHLMNTILFNAKTEQFFANAAPPQNPDSKLFYLQSYFQATRTIHETLQNKITSLFDHFSNEIRSFFASEYNAIIKPKDTKDSKKNYSICNINSGYILNLLRQDHLSLEKRLQFIFSFATLIQNQMTLMHKLEKKFDLITKRAAKLKELINALKESFLGIDPDSQAILIGLSQTTYSLLKKVCEKNIEEFHSMVTDGNKMRQIPGMIHMHKSLLDGLNELKQKLTPKTALPTTSPTDSSAISGTQTVTKSEETPAFSSVIPTSLFQSSPIRSCCLIEVTLFGLSQTISSSLFSDKANAYYSLHGRPEFESRVQVFKNEGILHANLQMLGDNIGVMPSSTCSQRYLLFIVHPIHGTKNSLYLLHEVISQEKYELLKNNKEQSKQLTILVQSMIEVKKNMSVSAKAGL